MKQKNPGKKYCSTLDEKSYRDYMIECNSYLLLHFLFEEELSSVSFAEERDQIFSLK